MKNNLIKRLLEKVRTRSQEKAHEKVESVSSSADSTEDDSGADEFLVIAHRQVVTEQIKQFIEATEVQKQYISCKEPSPEKEVVIHQWIKNRRKLEELKEKKLETLEQTLNAMRKLESLRKQIDETTEAIFRLQDLEIEEKENQAKEEIQPGREEKERDVPERGIPGRQEEEEEEWEMER